MKKVILAVAGLALVGTMATSAMAEFKFSGDARARMNYKSNFDDTWTAYPADDDSADTWNSRTRFKIEADTKGGAYVKTRVRLAEGTWDGTSNTRNKNNNIYTDYAYIGVPMGMVTVEGGLINRDVTPFLYFDGRADSLQVKYKNDKTGLVVFFDKTEENEADGFDFSDQDWFGFLLNQGFEGGWGLTVGGIYQDNSEAGFAGTVQVSGAVADVALVGEIAYQEENFLSATNDDGWGGYLQATVPVGPVSLLGMVGFTADGYNIDEADFGPFIMLQDYSQVSIGTDFSEVGEAFWAAIVPTFQVSEKLSISAQFSYVTVDPYAAGLDDQDLFEVGGTAKYAITDGASLSAQIGYADVDDLGDENPTAVGLSLDVSF
ncbi:porin [Desulfopila aestuarii]|uniref:Porin subfamily protein n=1 Tax=Desulfopila aestuarii DSM 18488 TaxID=1121416 RepID=A0A1M7YIM7_9BACT|nr:porin [Desulfopila aestuarii]SHO52494.1 Porin subfamily protein [Desulfopila aestuarii DSM 18488]